MKTKMLSVLAIVAAIVLSLTATPASKASELDQATLLTFNSPVRVPGRVLPPGSYWFVVLEDPAGNTHAVTIYNNTRTRAIATMQTETAERLKPTGKTVVTVAEPNSSTATPTLMTWFYPGRDFGHRFIYSSRREKELMSETRVTLPMRSSAAGQ